MDLQDLQPPFLCCKDYTSKKPIVEECSLLINGVESRAAKNPKGKKAIDIVFMPSFWNDVVYALKAIDPIVHVLSNPNIEMDCEVLEDLYKCIDKLSENDEFVDHIHNELSIYKSVGGMFGNPAAVRKRMLMALSLTCSSSECEHNCSTFEHDLDDSNEWIVRELDGDGDVED
ncbi:hypothetical protein CR513_18893, partial [Mucuna pruriens]